MPETHSDGAFMMAESIKDDIEQLAIPLSASLVKPVVSISFGIATIIPDQDHPPASIILLADKALYRSKDKGRDQISIG